MEINWNEFISKSFWFGIDRANLHRGDYFILYAGTALIGLAILLALYKMMAKNEFKKKVVGRIATIFFTIGFLEVIWFGLRYENITALGTKFASALILLAGLWWLYFPLKYFITRYSTDMEEAERKVQREKYINRK